jgi:hypothetical protein
MIARFLNLQGVAGLAASIALAVLLLLAKAETRHWKAESGRFEQLYRGEQSALAETIANYRAAAEAASAADRATAERVQAERRQINEGSVHKYEARLAAARARARQLRLQSEAAADPDPRGNAPMPRLPPAAQRAAENPGEARLPPSDALIATEQAIQLDELIKWVRRQAAVPPNGGLGTRQTKVDNDRRAVASPSGD